jgi:hypothetical protein
MRQWRRGAKSSIAALIDLNMIFIIEIRKAFIKERLIPTRTGKAARMFLFWNRFPQCARELCRSSAIAKYGNFDMRGKKEEPRKRGSQGKTGRNQTIRRVVKLSESRKPERSYNVC